MKHYFYSFLSFILSISIFVIFALFPSIPVYAKPYYTWEELRKDVTTSINYIIAQYNAVAKGDFSNYVQGLDSWEDYWNEDNVSISDDGQEVSYSPELTGMIKQALIQYSEESNGYWLVPTIDIHSIPLEYFPNKNCYDNLHTIIEELEVAGVANNGYYICDVASFMKDLQLSFVYTGVVSPTNDVPYVTFDTYFYSNKTWLGPYVCGPPSGQSFENFKYTKYFSGINTEGVSWSDGVTMDESNLNSSYRYAGPFCFNYNKGKNYTSLDRYNPTSWNSQMARYAMWSVDGRRMKIYKSEKAFLYGIEGERTVYFGSDFYDTTPKEITVTFDEMEDTLNKLGGVLDDLLDKIDKDTDESTIEKLLQQILDEMKNGGGGGDDDNKGNGNNGGSSYDDTGLLSLLSGYFNSVLAYLDGILEAIEALVWIEVDDSISEDQKDLFDLIDKIWQDPENGSQEAADAISGSFSDVARGLTKKFPFSIPWDIHALFTVFANAGNPEPAVMSYSAEPAVLYSDSGGIQTYAGDSGIITQEDHNAPYFVLPLVIESWGINEQVEIDLKDFQTLSTLSRTLFSLLFAVFLIKFTISVIKIYKGGSDD